MVGGFEKCLLLYYSIYLSCGLNSFINRKINFMSLTVMQTAFFQNCSSHNSMRRRGGVGGIYLPHLQNINIDISTTKRLESCLACSTGK